MSVPSLLVDVDVSSFEAFGQWSENEIHRKRALMDFLHVCEFSCDSHRCRRENTESILNAYSLLHE